MTVDKPEHRVFLLKMLTSEGITIPLSEVDALVDLREAVRAAAVAPPMPPAEG